MNHKWVRAADALVANDAGEMIMMTPTLSMLQRLATFSSVDEAIASAASATSGDDERIRIRYNVEGHQRIAYPGDNDYEQSNPTTENGMLRWPSGSLHLS